jgi:hypothetical protein
MDDNDDLDQALGDFLIRVSSRSRGEAARGEFDEAAYKAALDATPELDMILVKVLKRELTAEDAKRLAAPHIARFKERYMEIVEAKASDAD